MKNEKKNNNKAIPHNFCTTVKTNESSIQKRKTKDTQLFEKEPFCQEKYEGTNHF